MKREYYCRMCAVEYDLPMSTRMRADAAGTCVICGQPAPYVGGMTRDELRSRPRLKNVEFAVKPTPAQRGLELLGQINTCMMELVLILAKREEKEQLDPQDPQVAEVPEGKVSVRAGHGDGKTVAMAMEVFGVNPPSVTSKDNVVADNATEDEETKSEHDVAFEKAIKRAQVLYGPLPLPELLAEQKLARERYGAGSGPLATHQHAADVQVLMELIREAEKPEESKEDTSTSEPEVPAEPTDTVFTGAEEEPEIGSADWHRWKEARNVREALTGSPEGARASRPEGKPEETEQDAENKEPVETEEKPEEEPCEESEATPAPVSESKQP